MRMTLDRGLEEPAWTAVPEQVEGYFALPPAVILDIDETVLSNHSYHARLVRENRKHDSDLWRQWVLERRAFAVPGALEFAHYAQSRKVTVCYVTNRSHDVEDATRENLRALGFPIEDGRDTIFSR
ncbi:MAG: hypothetical protein JXD19_01345 [Deltaproteobacteria bacterium]|nr:hypothetical protein [Deltaproteobacteria bacterium]